MSQSENWKFCDLISPIEITPPKNWHITSQMLVGRLFSSWNAPYFRWHVGFGGVHMKCQNLLWANLSQQNLNLGDVQSWFCWKSAIFPPQKKGGIKAAVSWLNVYLRCLACQNSVVCCLKNETSKKKWRRKWRVKIDASLHPKHCCFGGRWVAKHGGTVMKKSNNPASLISKCLFWAYPGRLWKVMKGILLYAQKGLFRFVLRYFIFR